MPSKCTFICGLNLVKFDRDILDDVIFITNTGNKLIPPIRLTNDKERVKNLFSKEFYHSIGAIEFNHLLNGYPIVAFSETEVEFDEGGPMSYLNNHFFVLQALFFSMWIVKEHSATFDIGYLIVKTDENHPTISSNMLSQTLSKIDGLYTSTTFSLDEMRTVSDFLKKYITVQTDKASAGVKTGSKERISTAQYFLQSALHAPDVGLKAIGYCSVFETLFSSGSQSELSHRLAERVAKFIESNLENRVSTYKMMKKIYDVRSKVVHGALHTFKKTEELLPIVQTADAICRRVMLYAFTTADEENIFRMENDRLDDYFLRLILK